MAAGFSLPMSRGGCPLHSTVSVSPTLESRAYQPTLEQAEEPNNGVVKHMSDTFLAEIGSQFEHPSRVYK